METIESDGEKSIVDELNFGEKTAKRVKWEAFEFAVVGPRKVRVTNASYGDLADDHSYVVELEKRGARAVPARCECPADQYSEHYDCKHKVALAEKGGPLVIDTAMAYEPDGKVTARDTSREQREARTDGGVPADNEDCDCLPNADLPCFECYCGYKEVV